MDKRYEKPALTMLGDFAALTRGAGGSGLDNGHLVTNATAQNGDTD